MARRTGHLATPLSSKNFGRTDGINTERTDGK